MTSLIGFLHAATSQLFGLLLLAIYSTNTVLDRSILKVWLSKTDPYRISFKFSSFLIRLIRKDRPLVIVLVIDSIIMYVYRIFPAPHTVNACSKYSIVQYIHIAIQLVLYSPPGSRQYMYL